MTDAEIHAERLQNLRDKLLNAASFYVRLLDAEDLDKEQLTSSAAQYHRALARYIAFKLEGDPNADI